MTQDFDPAAVKRAALKYQQLARDVKQGVDGLHNKLSGLSGMAGNDNGAKDFCNEYDPAARDGMDAGAYAVNALNTCADLLFATAVNHENADSASAPNGQTVPASAPPVTPSITTPSIPSALGGSSPPSWWSSIEKYVQGAVWPNGDPEKLRQAMNTWCVNGEEIEGAIRRAFFPRDGANPITDVSHQRSPEIPQAVASMTLAHDAVKLLQTEWAAIGKTCGDLANRIEDVHNRVTNEMLILGGTVVATEAVAAVLVPLTIGGSEAVSKMVDTARLVATGERIAAILNEFRAAAQLSGLPNVAAGANLVRSIQTLGPLMNSRASLFLAEGAGLVPELTMAELYSRPSGLRVGTERAVQAAADKTADGKYFVSATDDTVLVPVSKSYDANILALPKTQDGKYFIDANGMRYPVDPVWHYGHVRGEELWRWQEVAAREGWSRQKWLDEMNNPRLYQIEDGPGNSGHYWELPRGK
ncbi:HNH/ENDO VII family nuclease [Mycobacteroides abscessus]|uniref:ADP-ribosyltransferse n=1 Tax=Mycobacteroides abscessus TaxID=36809 RepID=A0ABD7HL13_9MYCO|nr:HNH/ENDO VII family nuclease [Mycobacteroides abscessus]MDM2422761.1 HNH/ENDO VII family nuclease [Mycobacteroides abscessus]MDM2428028.1 HNH/ENDO VII family nuclease [Mycobacteroides abscessus]MDM2433049.1 HNH/ENDO VII family nuclease [Mycobacteroides abscessus]MDM2437786.1 HNH/ENDO VII family nuclease [Mycobacteroides abscessus]MDM2442122.1 HNH/ENDO VII family nuclease [Mycobacteroides abscessus]